MKDRNTELYQTMYLIRMSEEKIRIHYPNDQLKTPVHLCIGQEAIVTGVIHALKSIKKDSDICLIILRKWLKLKDYTHISYLLKFVKIKYNRFKEN